MKYMYCSSLLALPEQVDGAGVGVAALALRVHRHAVVVAALHRRGRWSTPTSLLVLCENTAIHFLILSALLLLPNCVVNLHTNLTEWENHTPICKFDAQTLISP